MLDLFVTYSQESRGDVRPLLEDLAAIGDTVWFTPEAHGGTAWWDQALSRIRSCDALLFALTSRTLESEACWRQLRYAQALDKPLLVVELRERADPASLPMALGSAPLVDCGRRDRESALRLCRALRPLGKAPPLPALLPSSPPPPPIDLASLRGRIRAAGKLDLQQQSALLAELAQDSRDVHSTLESRQLLLELRRRRELAPGMLEEIDALLRKTATTRINLRPPSGPPPSSVGAGAAASRPQLAQTRPVLPVARRARVDTPRRGSIGRVFAFVALLVVAGASCWRLAASARYDDLEGLHVGGLALTGGELVVLIGFSAALCAVLSLTLQLAGRRRAITARGR